MADDQSHWRWQWLPAAAVIAGALAVWTCAIVMRGTLGPWQWALWLAGVVALAGAVWFRRKLTKSEVEIEALRRQMVEREQKLAIREAAWEATRKVVEGELAQQSKQLAGREKAFAGKLTTFHEWMEFPQPLDLTSHQTSDAELSELVRKDRQLNELLAEETKQLFNDILANKYMVGGQFQPLLARDDLLALMRRVARIYRPDMEQPLLETSISLVLRAVSRASLQFLVIVEQLPLNVKEYSFNSLYGYIRQGVKAYGMYKSAEPYMPYFNTAMYLGRFALGANPVTLAAWWFLGAWGQQGARRLATQIFNRQALVMLQSLVRVVGYEVAGMYGGDFRRRDPNWIYAVELAELVHQFPLSRESLSHALKEVGALQLRHEYDRVYLYRCLAAHASPEPNRYRASLLLSAEERMAVARRLERFLEAFIHGQTSERVEKWRAEVEERIGVKLNVAAKMEDRSIREQTDDALRSLASFIIGVKEREPSEATELLHATRLFIDLPEADRERVMNQLLLDPPFFFEQPLLDPTSPIVAKYLQDLATLATWTAPHEGVIDDMLVDVAVYLRQDARKMRRLLDKQYVSYLAERLPPEAPDKRFPPAVARAVLDLVAPGESLRFVYSGVSFEWSEQATAPQYPRRDTYLVGVGERLVVFTLAERPVLLWRGEAGLIAERQRTFLSKDVFLRGGEWLGDVRTELPAVRVVAPMFAKEAYFRPLLMMCEQVAGRIGVGESIPAGKRSN